MTRTTTPAWRWKWHYCNKGNNIIATTAKTPWLQRCLHINNGNTIATRATTPAQGQQRRLRIDDGNNPIVTRAKNVSLMTTLAQLWQRCHHNEGNNRHYNDGKDACASTATTHHNEGNNAIAMTVTMPAHWWQQQCQCDEGCQLEDGNNAIAMRETIPLWIEGNNAIVTMATMPAQQQQWRLRINNGNNTIVMRATIAITTTVKMPMHWWQQCHHNKGNNASLTMSNEGNNASLTIAETPAHWGWQQRHCDKSNNCHCNNGKDAWALTATMPSWWEQQCQLDNKQHGHWRSLYDGGGACASTIAMTPSQQWQRCLRIDNSNNTIVTRATKTARRTMNNSCVIFFLARLAFWAKLLHLDLPNRERKVWTKAIALIPVWCQTIVYAIGLVGWRWPHLQKGKEQH